MRLLVVKTSSLGDVLHALAAVTDAARAVPGLRCDWLVEEAFAEIPAWHPAVGRVIPCALRRWRKNIRAARASGEWARFKQELQREPYDLVLDAQGLIKSAWLASMARGTRAGPDWAAAREPWASLFYQQRLKIPARESAHAVDRLRALFALGLGYPLPQTASDFGLDRARFTAPQIRPPYAVFLHATTWVSKQWPLAQWQELGLSLRGQGIQVVLPWGTAAEREHALKIGSAFNGHVPEPQTLTQLAGWLAHSRFVVGVDTGLAHLAAALKTPSVTLYGPTLPTLTGTVGANQIHLSATRENTVDRKRPTTVTVAQVQEALTSLPDRAAKV